MSVTVRVVVSVGVREVGVREVLVRIRGRDRVMVGVGVGVGVGVSVEVEVRVGVGVRARVRVSRRKGGGGLGLRHGGLVTVRVRVSSFMRTLLGLRSRVEVGVRGGVRVACKLYLAAGCCALLPLLIDIVLRTRGGVWARNSRVAVSATHVLGWRAPATAASRVVPSPLHSHGAAGSPAARSRQWLGAPSSGLWQP